ncbi:MAG: class I SAM-dependent methyltransferase [Pseudomonadota bacterium]
MTSRQSPQALARYYDRCLAVHGDTAQGAGWPNEPDRTTRFAVMAEALALAGIPIQNASVLDMACGTGAFLDWLKDMGQTPAHYVGVDISEPAIEQARQKSPDGVFVCMDVLKSDMQLPAQHYDLVVINGLFTVKDALSDTDMRSFLVAVLDRLWPVTGRVLALNVMSDVVDWRRDDLFHVPMDQMAELLFGVSGHRRAVFRSDYDLFEYTSYLFRAPRAERTLL